MVLVGNKCDLGDRRTVSETRGEELAAEFGCRYIETSTKDNINVKAVFEHLMTQIHPQGENQSKPKQKSCILL